MHFQYCLLVSRGKFESRNLADSNIRKSLKDMFDVSDLESADLSKCAREYLASIGMSSESVEALENNLRGDARALSPAA